MNLPCLGQYHSGSFSGHQGQALNITFAALLAPDRPDSRCPEEGFLPTIAALRDMVGHAWNDRSC